MIDACAIFKMNERRNLAAAYALYCEKDLEGAHSAGADTLATMEILLKQMERYSELLRTAAGLHEYCRDPSCVDDDGKFKWRGGEAVFSFGKHAGAPLRDVAETAPDYLDWMLGEDFPEETLTILRGAQGGELSEPGRRCRFRYSSRSESGSPQRLGLSCVGHPCLPDKESYLDRTPSAR